jgi:pimeloyl-ACP methyl ester carboxylesterase
MTVTTHPQKLVLIPGGGMSTWVWEKLIPLLQAECLPIATRLPVSNPSIRNKATIEDCVNHILAQMDAAGFDRAVILGHSGAGILAGQLARKAPERAQHLIFLSASIPQEGQNALHGLPVPVYLLNMFAMWTQNRRDSTSLRKLEGILRKTFCNTCTEEVIGFVLEQELLTEPRCVYREKISWAEFPPVSKTYIQLLQDRTHSLENQARMASNLAITDIREIGSDHMVMLSQPDALAKVIHAVLTQSS